MKTILLGAAGLVAMVAYASAADLAARPYTKAPPTMIAAIYDWSGFYIGLNGGGGTSRKCFDFAGFVTAPRAPIRDNCLDATGGVAGGQIGYRWQSGPAVFGLEAQGDWADLRGTAASTLFPGNSGRARIDGFGLFTGQIGYGWNSALLYLKGGAAVAADRYDTFVTATNAAIGAGSETRWGGAVGAGLEFGFAQNWSLAVEYDHMFMGTRNVPIVVPASAPAYPVLRAQQDVDLATVRLNYRWGGPAVARY